MSNMASNFYDRLQKIWITSEGIQNVLHFGESPTTTVFFAEEMQVIEFYPYFDIAWK